MSRTIVTTTHKPDEASIGYAKKIANELKVMFVERERRSLSDLREQYNCENVLVVKNLSLVLHTELGEYSFHPSMSVPRIKAIREGKTDHMVEAMSLREGDMVLDCTLGLGSDAIVASFVTGSNGNVVGLESAPELAYMVKKGMTEYEGERKALKDVMNRVNVICTDYLSFLREQPDKSFDIVYFDPMFRFPRARSSSMKPLRSLVNSEPVSLEAVKEAIRVARKRVVLKENWFSKEFERLGFTKAAGGRYSPVAFGIIERQEVGHE